MRTTETKFIYDQCDNSQGYLIHPQSRMAVTTEKGVHDEEKQQTGPNNDGSIAASETNEVAQDPNDAVDGRSAETAGKRWLARAATTPIWTPKRCRYDPDNPPSFTLGMNILLGFVRASLLMISLMEQD